jgi:hypothetical protein
MRLTIRRPAPSRWSNAELNFSVLRCEEAWNLSVRRGFLDVDRRGGVGRIHRRPFPKFVPLFVLRQDEVDVRCRFGDDENFDTRTSTC